MIARWFWREWRSSLHADRLAGAYPVGGLRAGAAGAEDGRFVGGGRRDATGGGGEVLREPDSGFNPFQTAPGIIINTADVEKTGAVQPGGRRVTWRYRFAGEPQGLQRFEN